MWPVKAYYALFTAALVSVGVSPRSWAVEQHRYDVVIAGGSTAALAAAVAAAQSGARTALLEPTDWIGGQLTASAVPAVDEAWHKAQHPDSGELLIDVARAARDPRNMTPAFRDMLLATGNPGRGWVSRFCFEPRPFMQQHLQPLVDAQGKRLKVFLNTVVKRCDATPATRRMTTVVAIERIPQPALSNSGYDQLLSQDLRDWYTETDSPRFRKITHRIRSSVFIDATEWGELLALSGASYEVGVDRDIDAATTPCGQAITYDFVQELHAKPQRETVEHQTVENLGYGAYEDRDDAWQQIWTYRRIRSSQEAPAAGDLCLQNWGYSDKAGHGGNDYPFAYLFPSQQQTKAEIDDWHGGVDIDVLAAAEQRALAWHTWFKQHAPSPWTPQQLTLARDVLGTSHGLAKMPYIRDTRRSVGINGFVLTIDDLVVRGDRLTGTVFDDRIALGAYAADIHPLVGCDYPDYVYYERQTLPFYIPLRALTNRDFDNLLVAGKTMAQDFMANSATRLHPIEWSTGTAAGVIAASMSRNNWTTSDALAHVAELRQSIARLTPVDWSLPESP